MSLKWSTLFSVFFVFSFTRGANVVTQDFSRVESEATSFVAARKVKPEQTLVAFDYDDTLLSPVSIIGSEAWFTWQESLLKIEDAPDRLVNDFDSLLILQNRLLGLIRFRPTEAKNPDVIRRLQNRGFQVIVCTSRGPDEVTSTLRELRLSGIDLSKGRFSTVNEAAKPYYPYDLKQPWKAGLSATDIGKLALSKSRMTVFVGGVFLTEGQNKGVMLRTLVNRSKIPIRALVFIDNRLKHIDQVEAAFKGKSIKTFTVHYNAVDIDSSPMSEEKTVVSKKEYEHLKSFIE